MRRLLLTLVLVAPLAAGHAAPDPLDVEVHVLADDVDDAYAAYDGFDLQDVYVREADLPAGAGVVFRVYVYSAFGPAPVATTLSIEVEAAGQSVRATTNDLDTWTGATVVEAEFETDESGIDQGYVQILVPYDQLGVGPGATLDGFAARSYADDDLRDLAPGGRPVPGTGGAAEVPAESTVVTPSIEIAGPSGYTQTQITRSGEEVVVQVSNLITAVGQHIYLSADDTTGWSVSGLDTGTAVEPGQHPAFTFNATADEGATPLTFHVRTDLGGRETLTLTPATGDGPPGEETTTDTEESPVGLVALIGLGAAAARRR